MSEALNSMPHGISLWNKDDVLERANTLAYSIHKGSPRDHWHHRLAASSSFAHAYAQGPRPPQFRKCWVPDQY